MVYVQLCFGVVILGLCYIKTYREISIHHSRVLVHGGRSQIP